MFVNNKILFIFINKLKLKLKDKFMWRNKKEDSTVWTRVKKLQG